MQAQFCVLTKTRGRPDLAFPQPAQPGTGADTPLPSPTSVYTADAASSNTLGRSISEMTKNKKTIVHELCYHQVPLSNLKTQVSDLRDTSL